jgi:hypothetical protein
MVVNSLGDSIFRRDLARSRVKLHPYYCSSLESEAADYGDDHPHPTTFLASIEVNGRLGTPKWKIFLLLLLQYTKLFH